MCYSYSTKFDICGCLWTEWSARCGTTASFTATTSARDDKSNGSEDYCAGHRMVSVTYPDLKCEACRAGEAYPSHARSGTYRDTTTTSAKLSESEFVSGLGSEFGFGSESASGHGRWIEDSDGEDGDNSRDTSATAPASVSAPASVPRFEEMEMDVSRVCDVVSGRRIKVRRVRTRSDDEDDERVLSSFRLPHRKM